MSRTLQDQLDDYAETGYLVVPEALSDDEVTLLNDAVDRDRETNDVFWYEKEKGKVEVSVHILAANIEMDLTMRPATLAPLMAAIMGPELCAEEHSIRIRLPNTDGQPECNWHRDASRPDPDVPFRTRYLSIVYYLTDVDSTTHTFSVIPGSAQTDDLPGLADYDLDSAHHIEGPAGTAILFNASMFHAGNVRRTPSERRTIHIYCGRASDRFLSNYTIFPHRLWEDSDEETRRYYSRPNPITRLLLDRF